MLALDGFLGLFADPVDLLQDSIEALTQVFEFEVRSIVRVCVFLPLVVIEVNALVVSKVFSVPVILGVVSWLARCLVIVIIVALVGIGFIIVLAWIAIEILTLTLLFSSCH